MEMTMETLDKLIDLINADLASDNPDLETVLKQAESLDVTYREVCETYASVAGW